MDWYHSVDISAIHAGFRSGTISEEAIGPKVAEILEKDLLPEVGYARKRELKDIIQAFSECDNIERYDVVLEYLYNWGDTRMLHGKLCWINTFAKGAGA